MKVSDLINDSHLVECKNAILSNIGEAKVNANNYTNRQVVFTANGVHMVLETNWTDEYLEKNGIRENTVGTLIYRQGIREYNGKLYNDIKREFNVRLWIPNNEDVKKEKPEPEQKPQEKNEVQKAAADRMMADAAADANDPEATTNLPF